MGSTEGLNGESIIRIGIEKLYKTRVVQETKNDTTSDTIRHFTIYMIWRCKGAAIIMIDTHRNTVTCDRYCMYM